MNQTVTAFLLLLITLTFSTLAQDEPLKPENVLLLGPFETTVSVSETDKSKDDKISELISLKQLAYEHFQPAANTQESATGMEWVKQSLSDGSVELTRNEGNNPQIYFLAYYIHTETFVEAELEISSCLPLKAYVNNEEIGSNTIAPAEEDCEEQKVTKKLSFERGRHLLLIKTVLCPSFDFDNAITVSVTSKEDNLDRLSINTDPVRFAGVDQLLFDPKAADVEMSADGSYAAVFVRDYTKGVDSPDNSMLIYDGKTGAFISAKKTGKPYSQFTWLPVGENYSYVRRENGKATLWLGSVANGDSKPVLENIDDFGGYTWANDASFLVYSATEKVEKDKSGVRKLRDLSERPGEDRNKTHLYLHTMADGSTRKITEYDSSAYLVDIHPDNKQLLYAIGGTNYARRPYNFTTVYLYDIASGKSDSLLTLYFGNRIMFTPDGKKLLITGGPSVFGELGFAIDSGTIPNDYDTQAYLYDLETKEVEPISKSFDPSIGGVYRSYDGKHIYFTVTERTYASLYRYSLVEGTYSKVELKTEVLDRIAFARNAPYAVYYGSNATEPVKVYRLNLTNDSSALLFDPNEESFRYTKTGRTAEFNYTKPDGTVIEGLVYYPPDYTQEKDYPCIVYFYGGTSPVTRDYEGRYPKNIWAANGYFVYVIQPSGATGYGQEFSSRHVNDWGKITGDEIINATKNFLDHHPIVDPERVGCIGASYGGYMTMNVLTKTDMFAAAISHAGISSLSSYWGEGDWGYLYSAVATANSFPWNRTDIYVDESPLFNADKITTPLLLTHGSIDNNVPPGESKQFYTALKLLGKEVEMIEIADQQHWVLDYPKREKWTKALIAWFDKYLKKDAGWWNNLFEK